MSTWKCEIKNLALTYMIGCKYYYSDGTTSSIREKDKIPHRLDGPAIIKHHKLSSCEKVNSMWCRHGKLHREDGPADVESYIYEDGTIDHIWEVYYLDNLWIPREEYNEIIQEVNEMPLALMLTDPREWVRNLAKRKSTNE